MNKLQLRCFPRYPRGGAGFIRVDWLLPSLQGKNCLYRHSGECHRQVPRSSKMDLLLMALKGQKIGFDKARGRER